MPFCGERFAELPVVGILRGCDPDVALDAIEAAYAGGLRTVEITMNSPGAARLIAQAAARFGDRMNVGAGTVLTGAQLDEAWDAGASFIVTPVVDMELVEHCVEQGCPVLPGAFTPTEILAAWRGGAWAVKVFPADTLGPAYVKAVLAPLNEVRLAPVGGVDADLFVRYMEAGAAGVGAGGPLFNAQWLRDRAWDRLIAETARWKEAWNRLRQRNPALADRVRRRKATDDGE